jgi:hypothetical protein
LRKERYLMSDEATRQSDQGVSLESLEKYISGLWRIGGMPLAIVGLGAIALFMPTSPIYSEVQRALLAGVLFLLGALSWTIATLIAFKRWRAEAEISAQQSAKIIEIVARLAEAGNSIDVTQKTQALIATVSSLQKLQQVPVPTYGGSGTAALPEARLAN